MDRASDIDVPELAVRIMQPAAHAHYALGFETAHEHPEPSSLEVIGQIPSWLSGTLLRTAPARFEVGKPR
jgi:beta,beta-carotene 9',10'-dioxygenase